MHIDFTKDGKIVFLKPYKVIVPFGKFIFPKGFKSDGASIPWIVQWFGDPYDGDTLDAALVHDGLYMTRGVAVYGGDTLLELPRVNVDRIFLDIMRHQRVNFIKREIYFFMVRMFGWWPWYVSPIFMKKRRNCGIMVHIKTLKI